jgi:arylsulfatase A-like enzyme
MRTKDEAHSARMPGVSRREFLKAGALGGAAFMTGCLARGQTGRAPGGERPPNFLFIITDQQGLDTMSAVGCRDIHTPNMDRLVRRGVTFMESYSANPLCSPARSGLFTGRPTLETGVIQNGLPIRSDIPNMGQWLGERGYEAVYTGKWHLPQSFAPQVPGFTNIASGIGGQGNVGDAAVSRACQGYLHNRTGDEPFLLVASFLQPHDVCQWVSMHRNAPDELPYPEIAGKLPKLPPNFAYDENEPLKLKNTKRPSWSPEQWRYYVWSYYRLVEMVDAEIGRVLQALEDTGQAENTVIILTADHGEGRGRHQMVLKNYLYDEAAKVPLLVSCPGRMPEDRRDRAHLVSGLDVLPTVCDYAGVEVPEHVRGRSLRPLLEGDNVTWREFVPSEVQQTGRMIRTPGHKYVTYEGDPVEQLFDMESDPGETKNLAADATHADALEAHRKLLRDWEASLDKAPT